MSVPADVLGVYTARCAGGDGGGLDRFLPSDRTTYYAYGRQALAEALRRIRVGAGASVLLPGLICREVLASVAAVGADVVFYGVDDHMRPDVGSLERLPDTRTRALVVVNYFGWPQPLDELRPWCRDRGLVLIEDNAHGFLSADDGTLLGHRGDFGIFSLRKTLALPNGAALVDNRPAPLILGARVGADGSPRRSEWRYRAKAAVKLAMLAGDVRSARAAVRAIGLARRLVSGSALPRPAADAERAMPAEAFSPLAGRLLRCVDVDAEIRRRRRLYTEYQRTFATMPEATPLFADLGPAVAPHSFPFVYHGANADAFIARSARSGITVQRWPDLPRAIEATAPEHYRRIMLVPFLW
ncbi:MAG: DegT/DnrJ/EryC1/StrS family aminotransferase [Candidatus Rokubacteria bacterium]|nr:DegT/DnrJ/EryC1/StrS family aminotransferase [Candidatus Rokubacteria bacterium]